MAALERSFSTGKSLVFAAILVGASFLLIEGVARFAAFARNGWNPAYLTWGIRTVVIEAHDGHNAAHAGYFKYPPNRVLHQYGKVSTEVHINNLGFRGPDFAPKAKPAQFRVVAMGESSTFGYYNRDDETYPYLLERLLRRRFPTADVAILNAGIPHMNSDHMVAMLREEIAGYRPHVVTLYSGYNDAAVVLAATPVQRLDRWMHGHLASYIAMKWVLSKLVASAAGMAGTWSSHGWAKHLENTSREYVETQARLHATHYGSNLREFVELARRSGAEPIFMRQHMTTTYESPEYSFRHAHGPVPAGLSYEQEADWIAEQLEREGYVSAYEAILLIHRAQLRAQDAVAAELEVPVIDNVLIVDQRPEYHASFVHLTGAGNQALADALAEVLAPRLQAHLERAPRPDDPERERLAGGR